MSYAMTASHRLSRHPVRLAAVASLSVLLAVGCGGKQSVASKSAAAYREAREKGLPVGEGVHGGHAASEKGGMAGMDHSKMQQGGMAGMDRSKMQQGGMAGMDRSKIKQGGGMAGMAGMDHSKLKQGEGMNSMAMGDPATAAIVADKSAAAMPGKAAAILSPDPLDAPAATAAEDAQRSARMNEMMASGDGMTMSPGNYVHKDAGRPQATPTGKR
jgi:hypothetical protein